MTFPTVAGRVILVTRGAETRDSSGNYVTTNTYRQVRGVLNPGGSSELIQGQDTVITQPSVYFPPGIELGPFDAVITGGTFVDGTTPPVGGDLYEVDGSPNEYPQHPYTGRRVGVEVKLQRVTG